MLTLVIVRAHRGEPVKLVEIERGEKLVYVASERSLERIASGEIEPIGVPKEDVFPFDPDSYERLKESWEAGSVNEQWDRLRKLVSKG